MTINDFIRLDDLVAQLESCAEDLEKFSKYKRIEKNSLLPFISAGKRWSIFITKKFEQLGEQYLADVYNDIYLDFEELILNYYSMSQEELRERIVYIAGDIKESKVNIFLPRILNWEVIVR